MEKTTLEALDWQLSKGNIVSPAIAPQKHQITIRRRFQFSSALKRMSTLSHLPTGKTLAAVKGAPETIKTMLADVPAHYDETYKWFTRNGSRVLALASKEMETMSIDRVRPWCCRELREDLRVHLDQQDSSGASGEQSDVCWIPCVSLPSEGRRR